MPRNKKADLERIDDLVHADHVCGCGDSSCDITAAYENGQTLWAAHLLLSAGAASDELDRLYSKVKPSKRSLDRECAQFVKDVPYTECTDCGSVNWNTNPGETNHCWQCAKTYVGKKD